MSEAYGPKILNFIIKPKLIKQIKDADHFNY